MAHLVMQHLAKRYGKRWVVKDVSFSVERGQVVGILGRMERAKPRAFIWWSDLSIWTKAQFI